MLALRVVSVSVEAGLRRTGEARTRLGVLVAVGVLLSMAVGTGLLVLLGGNGLTGLGLPDPGLFTRPRCQPCGCCPNALLMAAFLVPLQASGYLDTGGYVAVRTGADRRPDLGVDRGVDSDAAGCGRIGRPVTEVLDLRLLASMASALSQVGAWALTAGIVLMLTGFCWTALTWSAAVWLFALSIVGLTPVALTGDQRAGPRRA